ncbi:thaumatin family protein [Sporobolomyces koalae]|uniref:thaumatin family protein n=1 Tax=Sporobolomyces koalae TaxID=500713 RepID=UPI00317A555F
MLVLSNTLVALALATLVSARTITVKNNCASTIWPAIFTSSGTAPSSSTGWTAKKGSSVAITIADNWSGRIWARTGCTFPAGTTLPATCATGGCNGGLQCDRASGTGVPPATLAEFTFTSSLDWYDISNVDGSNLPVAITNTAKCPAPACKADLNKSCPAALSRVDKSGNVVGCLTACAANLDGNPANSKNCCSGSFSTPQICPTSGVQYYSYFKKACPDAYACAYDESSKSALWTCPASKKADYTVTFCP